MKPNETKGNEKIKTFKKGGFVIITQGIYADGKGEVFDFMVINGVPTFGVIVNDNELVFIDQKYLIDGNS